MKVYEVVKWLGRQAAAGTKDKGERRGRGLAGCMESWLYDLTGRWVGGSVGARVPGRVCAYVIAG